MSVNPADSASHQPMALDERQHLTVTAAPNSNSASLTAEIRTCGIGTLSNRPRTLGNIAFNDVSVEEIEAAKLGENNKRR